MADLPPSVAEQILVESSNNIQHNNNNQRNLSTIANNILQMAGARNFDELGVAESRANSGLIATPVASPATQQT